MADLDVEALFHIADQSLDSRIDEDEFLQVMGPVAAGAEVVERLRSQRSLDAEEAEEAERLRRQGPPNAAEARTNVDDEFSGPADVRFRLVGIDKVASLRMCGAHSVWGFFGRCKPPSGGGDHQEIGLPVGQQGP